jgi:photosystem II stability/assembly factor-like uncharacterized protein
MILLFTTWAFSQWKLATSGSAAAFRGIHKSAPGIIWASGTNGTVLRSEDDGYLWQQCAIPSGAEKLDFRAVFGWDPNHAMVLSSGTGSASRLYETTDGCASWHLLFENPDAQGFWDALVFVGTKGYILGDPVNGRLVFYESDDLGKHWRRDESPGLSAAPKGEGAFAASNSSLALRTDGEPFFATGGIGGPRVFGRDSQRGWTSLAVPLAGGKETAGVFSLAFRDAKHGVAVGGDYKEPDKSYGTAAWTSDGGISWHASEVLPAGYRSCVAWYAAGQAWLAVGPSGSDVSRDDGHTWKRLDSENWNALSLPWAVGPKGRIGSLNEAALGK